MKAILEFNLEEPEEREALNDAINVQKYKDVIRELDDKLRSMHKYTDKTHIDIMEVRDIINDLLNTYSVEA